MDKHDAERKFRVADQYYREGRYGQAMLLLDALDEAFPNTRHIMYPRALCLARLKRREEALALCDELIARFQYSGAIELKAALSKEEAPPLEEIPHIPGFDTTVIKRPPKDAIVKESRLFSKPVLIAGIAVLCVLVIGALLFALQVKPGPTEPAQAPVATETAPEEAPAPEEAAPLASLEKAMGKLVGTGITLLFLIVLIWMVETVLALYLALSFADQLPYKEFFRDILHVGVVGVGVGILNGLLSGCCPLIGALVAFLVTFFILRTVYDIEFLDYLYYIAFTAAFGLLNWYVVFPELANVMHQQVVTFEPAIFEEFGEVAAPAEPPPPLPAADLTGNLLVNGSFDGLSGWREIREVGAFEMPTLDAGENHVYWQRTPFEDARGELGVAQDLDIDVSGAQSLVLSLYVWVDQAPPAEPSEPPTKGAVQVELEYTDWYAKPQLWVHRFEIDGAGSTTSPVPKAEWSEFLFDLFVDPSWVDTNGNPLPRPATLTGFRVFSEGVDLSGAVGNILLQAY